MAMAGGGRIFVACLECEILLIAGAEYCPLCGTPLWEQSRKDGPARRPEPCRTPELMR